MGVAISSAPTTFSDHVFKFLERVEHRVASNPVDREAAFRLRYDAYRRVGFLKARPEDKLYDPLYDDDPMAWISMSFVDGELAGTVRVNNVVRTGVQSVKARIGRNFP
jgi:hypothetical protein